MMTCSTGISFGKVIFLKSNDREKSTWTGEKGGLRRNHIAEIPKNVKCFHALRFSIRARPPDSNPATVMKFLVLLFVVALGGCAQKSSAVRTGEIAPAKTAAAPAPPGPAAAASVRAEQIRTDCIKGRRLICGRVLQIFPDGLVVDSGYTDLLRPPLTRSWVVPGTATASRDPAVLELKEPGTPCIGLAFLTDIPKRPQVKNYDYVVIMGYPAGQVVYTPAPNIEKIIRKFSGGLDTAVRLNLRAEESKIQAQSIENK
jgi:hypothetical protein